MLEWPESRYIAKLVVNDVVDTRGKPKLRRGFFVLNNLSRRMAILGILAMAMTVAMMFVLGRLSDRRLVDGSTAGSS